MLLIHIRAQLRIFFWAKKHTRELSRRVNGFLPTVSIWRKVIFELQ